MSKTKDKKAANEVVENKTANAELKLTENSNQTEILEETTSQAETVADPELETPEPVTENTIEEFAAEPESLKLDGAAPAANDELDAAGNKIPDWYKKHQADVAKEAPTEVREILAQAITKNFADRAKTNLPGLTEKDIRAFAGPNGKSVQMAFTFSNDDKTSGYITIAEFGKTVRCPEEGEFTFGIDFSND